MKGYVSIFKDPDEIELRVRAEGHGVVGDALRVLKPGDTAFGWSYEALLMHGEGMVDLEGE
jgi:hypothetical protein